MGNSKTKEPETPQIPTEELNAFWSRPIIKYSETKGFDLPKEFPKDISHDAIYLVDVRYLTPELLEVCKKLEKVKCAFGYVFTLNKSGNVRGIESKDIRIVAFSGTFSYEDDKGLARILLSVPDVTIIEKLLYQPNPEDQKHFEEYDAIIEKLITDKTRFHLIPAITYISGITVNCHKTIPKNILWKFINNRKYILFYITKPDIDNYGLPKEYVNVHGVTYIWLNARQYHNWPTVRYTPEQLQQIKAECDAKERQKIFNELQSMPVPGESSEGPRFDPVKLNDKDLDKEREEGQV